MTGRVGNGHRFPRHSYLCRTKEKAGISLVHTNENLSPTSHGEPLTPLSSVRNDHDRAHRSRRVHRYCRCGSRARSRRCAAASWARRPHGLAWGNPWESKHDNQDICLDISMTHPEFCTPFPDSQSEADRRWYGYAEIYGGVQGPGGAAGVGPWAPSVGSGLTAGDFDWTPLPLRRPNQTPNGPPHEPTG